MTNASANGPAVDVGLFLGALVTRVVLLGCLAGSTGMEWRNLALLYDGHVYMLISHYFPILYPNVSFTGWFPVYPFLIFLADLLFSDPRVSAIVVSVMAGSLSVVLFYHLAREFTPRPLLSAVVFCCFTPTWLLTSTLAFVESVFACLFIGTVISLQKGWTKSAVALAGLTIVTQKSGILILPTILLFLVWRNGLRGLRQFAPFVSCLIPVLLLQGYLYYLFDDPLANVHALRQPGAYPELFALPFTAMISGLLDHDQIFRGHFWLRKSLLALSLSFYVTCFAAYWIRPSRFERLLIVWLGVVLLFNLSLAGHWAYYGFPRFMTAATPPAILIAINRLRLPVSPRRMATLTVVIPFIVLVVVLEVRDAIELMIRIWPAQYVEQIYHILGLNYR
jgi:hypothetical protein